MRYNTTTMLQLSEPLLSKQVLSLRTGGPIATVLQPIINPNNLKIEGFYCEDRFDKSTLVLLTQDIRDTLKQGYAVNDHEALVKAEDLIRLKKVININFQLPGKHVVTVDKEKVGKVTDFATETSTFYIQKIYVGQSILKSLSAGQLSVDRNQIVEITDKKIIIQELLKPQKASIATTAIV